MAMPVKNCAAYLAEAIESVLAEEGVDFTLHVVDNRSDDASADVTRRHLTDRRVGVDVNDRDFQAYGSLKRILAQTPAEYYVPFAADDVMHQGNLACKVEAFDATGAGFAHSRPRRRTIREPWVLGVGPTSIATESRARAVASAARSIQSSRALRTSGGTEPKVDMAVQSPSGCSTVGNAAR